MNFVILISIMILFFLIIWGLTYKFHRTSFKIVTWLIWGTSFFILCASVFWTVIDMLYLKDTSAFGLQLEGMSNSMGTFSFLWGLAAVFIFFSRRLYYRIKETNGQDVLRRILLLAKNHHNLFGWVTLAAATAHGVYFIFHKPHSWFEFYSGTGAWAALVLLAVTGMRMSILAKSPKTMRLSHISLTAGYLGAMILHFRGSIILSIFLYAAAFIAMGIIWGLMRLTQALKSE